MLEIGTIIRLQVQTGSLKRGERPNRIYDTSNLEVVPALRLTKKGVIGLLDDGKEQLDVHHSHHPYSRRRQSNGISFNFTSHYGRMQAYFGSHLEFGCAGENILVEGDRLFTLAQLAPGLVIATGDGQQIRLHQVGTISPCVPFSEYALNQDAKPSAARTKEVLQFLDHGTRGFYCELTGDTAVIRPGNRLLLTEAAPPDGLQEST
jgi:hypothetical protein